MVVWGADTHQAEQRRSPSSLARGVATAPVALRLACPPVVTDLHLRGAESRVPIQAVHRFCRKATDSNSDNLLTTHGDTWPSNAWFSRPGRAAFATARRSASSLICYRPAQKGYSARAL